MTGVHVVGESSVGLPTAFEQDETQVHGCAFSPGLYQPILDQASFASSATQPADFPDRGALRIPNQAEAAVLLQATKNLNRAVQAVGQDQGALSKAVDGRQCSGELGRRRIHFEPKLGSNPSEEIVNRQKTARQHHPFLGAQDLQPSRDPVEARAIDHDDIGELLHEVRQLLAVALRCFGHNELDEASVERHEEAAREVPAPLEERLGARLDLREKPSWIASTRSLQELSRRLRRCEDHQQPKARQHKEAPLALTFGSANVLEDLVAQGLAQVLVQELDRRHQLNLALTVALRVGRALPRLSLPLLLFCHGISPPRKTSREEGHGSHLSDSHDAKMAEKNLGFYKSLSEYDLNYLSGDGSKLSPIKTPFPAIPFQRPGSGRQAFDKAMSPRARGAWRPSSCCHHTARSRAGCGRARTRRSPRAGWKSTRDPGAQIAPFASPLSLTSATLVDRRST